MKNQRAITLVALTITVIVLLILATVSISLVINGGIIDRADKGVQAYSDSEIEEQIKLAYNEYNMAKYTNDSLDLVQFMTNRLEETYKDSTIDITPYSETEAFPMLIKIDNREFLLNEDGTSKVKNGITEYDVAKHPENYYGHYVTNYNSPSDAGIVDAEGQLGKWQIFMADDTNIYLIASNYISRYYTGTKNGVGFNYDESIEDTRNVYKMWFTSIKDQYNANSTTTDIPEILSRLDKQNIYHKWMNNTENQTKNYNNEKAVACILDVDVWSGYRNNTYAKYAIGGPTIEMFFKVLNDSHTTNRLEAVDSYNYGYKTKKGENIINGTTSAIAASNYSLVNSMLYLYSNEASQYWIASPSSQYCDCIYYIMSNRKICSERYYYYSNTTMGFRPLVCLNSNVHLVLNEDGQTYSLEVN